MRSACHLRWRARRIDVDDSAAPSRLGLISKSLTWFATNWRNADSRFLDNSRPSASPLDDAFRRQPENDVAVAPTGAAQRAQPVDHSGGQLNQVLAALGLGRIEAATAKKPN